MDTSTKTHEGKAGRKLFLFLFVFIVTSAYFGCTYAFRYPFVGMLPADFETQAPVFVQDKYLKNCQGGVAVFELSDEVKNKILDDESEFFGNTMTPRIKRQDEDAYIPWKKTPLPISWADSELPLNSWGGLGCAASEPIIRRAVDAAWRDGGYYTKLNRGQPSIVALPKLGLVVVSYSNI